MERKALAIISYVLANMILYMASFQVPKEILQKMDYFRTIFFGIGKKKRDIGLLSGVSYAAQKIEMS